ncbi:MAG: hypothetical protein HY062_16465, partial [Bacteroidetes bacterium]|nr:hypothetical protein [Bacteroidota bacterium]
MNKQISFSVLFFMMSLGLNAQIMLNGNFLLGTTAWGCSAEINAETVYGGSNGLNSVAEVDAAAGLCQTVIGLGIGNVYTLSYDCTRRLGGCPSPNPTNMLVTVDAGALSKTDTRVNTSFGWSTSSYNFTAVSTSHTISFSAGAGFGGSTCGMIMDNIVVTLSSPLPIELLYFNANVSDNNSVLTNWETASELNNDFFTVEKSQNSLDWEVAAVIKSAGTSTQSLKYSFSDHTPYKGISYYRLKQTDKDGKFKYTPIQSVSLKESVAAALYPNPSITHVLNIEAEDTFPYNVILYNTMGEIIYSSPNHT